MNTTWYYSEIRQMSIKVLAHQTGLKKALTEAYSEICLKPYGYLVLDLRPKCIENHQITTEIFPDEYKIIYVPA